MSEYGLRAKFSEVELKQLKSTEIDSQQLLENSGKRRCVKDLTVEDNAFRGKKDLAGADLRGYDLNGVGLSGEMKDTGWQWRTVANESGNAVADSKRD